MLKTKRGDIAGDTPEGLASDLLVGAEAIRQYLGPAWTRRMVLYAHERAALPVFRIGARRLAARKSELDAALRARAGRPAA